jgi:anaerobic ribonucleoside-triphosphate reductase
LLNIKKKNPIRDQEVKTLLTDIYNRLQTETADLTTEAAQPGFKFEISYDLEFVSFFARLREKYPDKLFDMEGIGKQLDFAKFSRDFYSTKTTTAADVSVDANSNVDEMSVIAYNVEMPKPMFRINALYLLWKYGRQLYGNEEAEAIIESQISGDYYINDMSGLSAPYCFNFSTYDVAINGLPFVQKVKSGPPKHLSSFIGQLIHFTVYASNSILGAVGLADFLIVAAYYVDLLLQDNPFKTEELLWKSIKQEMQSFIYSCNQPFRGGHQCVPDTYQVATPTGYKTKDQLQVGDPIYVWKDNKLEVEPILALNVYDFDGDLDCYDVDKNRELLFTPEHRIFLWEKATDTFQLQESKDVVVEAPGQYSFPTATDIYSQPAYPLTDDEIKLAVYFLVMGETKGDGTLAISRSHRKNRFPTPLIDALNSSNLPYHQVIDNDRFEIGLDLLVSFHIQSLLNNGKAIPAWAFQLDRYQSCLFIQTWNEAYGCARNPRDDNKILNLRCKDLAMQEDLGLIAVQAGYTSKYGEWTQNDMTEIKRLVVTCNPRPQVMVNSKSQKAYTGQVWCPTTSAGIVMFRAEHLSFFSGNSGFYNISIFDGQFLDKLCQDYVFEGGVTPKKEVVLALQSLYIDLMNETLQTSPITFPVTSACFARDDNNEIVDKDYLKIVAEKNLAYGFMNFYFGKTSTLSSCCFDQFQRVTVKVDGKEETDLIGNIVEKALINDSSLQVYEPYNMEWAPAKPVKTYYRGLMYRITVGEHQINVTADHLFPIFLANKDKAAADLVVGDNLVVCLKEIQEGSTCIQKIETYAYAGSVYCFEVEDGFNAYFLLENGVITHNCRLRSDTNNEYFNSFGSGSSKIGSLGVVTLNLPRIGYQSRTQEEYLARLEVLAERAVKINNIKRFLIKKRIKTHSLPLYDHGFMDLGKQYSTTGLNGINEAVTEMGLDILRPDGQVFVKAILNKVNQVNDRAGKQYKSPHNCEQTPSENSAIKMADKDRAMGLQTRHHLYSNQFIPLTTKADLLDRIKLQGLFDNDMSGGAICHLNIEQTIEDVDKMVALLTSAAKQGVVYIAVNYTLQQCAEGHMAVGKNNSCSLCGAEIVGEYTRTVGFLTATKNWHKTRREHDWPNRVFYKTLDEAVS